MSNILISAGSIPAKLDSVKYIGNKFSGGLAFKTAQQLKILGFNPTIILWKYAKILPSNINIVKVDDILEYYDYITTGPKYDAYILAGAVANLMPITPWTGKFPSHNYKPGDEFNIKFTIAPRIIDQIKKKYPRSTLIGYKLFDGSEEELIRAAQIVLLESKANVIFANTPQDAKIKKIAVMPDGSLIPLSFNEHIKFIANLINSKWFKTLIRECSYNISEEEQYVINHYPRSKGFGTFAIKRADEFITSSRGKRDTGIAKIESINFNTREIRADKKSTLNAPLLANIFEKFPKVQYIFHNHKFLKGVKNVEYRIPGTMNDIECEHHTFNIKYHGYIKSCNSFVEAKRFINNELEYLC